MLSSGMDAVSLDTQIAHMTREMLACRDLGHSWDYAPLEATITKADRKTKKQKVIEAERVITCKRQCGCVRTDYFLRDDYGNLTKYKSGIKYPPGYVLERDDPDVPTGHFTKNAARMTLMARLAPGLVWD